MRLGLGANIVIRRSGRSWVWNLMTLEESIASGKEPKRDLAAKAAKDAANNWLAQARKMLGQRDKMTQEQRDLCRKFDT